MRLFNSPRWTQCLQVSCMALVVSLMLASFHQLLARAQGKSDLAVRAGVDGEVRQGGPVCDGE